MAYASPPTRDRRARPKVCAAIGTLGPGGAERQLVTTLLGLKDRFDVDLEVVVMYLDEEWQRFFLPVLTAAGIEVVKVSRDLRAGDLAAMRDPIAGRLGSAVARLLPAELSHVLGYCAIWLARRPDVVHLWLDEVNIKAGLAASLCGVARVVLSMRSVNPSHFVFYQPYMRSGYRVLLQRPEVHALNNSSIGALDYAHWLGVDPQTITVVRNGVDFSRLTPQGGRDAARVAYRQRHEIPADTFVMGGVMRLTEEKRPLLWLEAAAIVAQSRRDIRFLLVGDGTQRPQVEARIDALGLRQRVTLVGHEHKPFDSMAAMDVLLLSSIFEGSPNVLIEAQALGVPVVTMPAGGAVEVVEHGRTGWIAASGTATEAAQYVINMAADRELYARVSAAAPAFVRARFDVDRMIEETATAYGGLPPRAHAESARSGA